MSSRPDLRGRMPIPRHCLRSVRTSTRWPDRIPCEVGYAHRRSRRRLPTTSGSDGPPNRPAARSAAVSPMGCQSCSSGSSAGRTSLARNARVSTLRLRNLASRPGGMPAGRHDASSADSEGCTCAAGSASGRTRQLRTRSWSPAHRRSDRHASSTAASVSSTNPARATRAHNRQWCMYACPQ